MIDISIEHQGMALAAAGKALPATRIGLYLGAGVLVGRKVVQGVIGASYKVASAITPNISRQQEWNTQGTKYLEAAKKNLGRDLAIGTALIATGLLTEKLEDFVAEKQSGFNADNQSFFEITGQKLSGIKEYVISLIPSGAKKKDMSYPAEKLPSLESIHQKMTIVYEDAVKNFRITRPYQPAVYTNFFGYCGPQCSENAYNKASDLTSSTWQQICTGGAYIRGGISSVAQSTWNLMPSFGSRTASNETSIDALNISSTTA